MKHATLMIVLAGVLATLSQAWARPTPLSAAFTYQGHLKQNGTLVTDSADFQFTLWDAANGPSQVGSVVAVNGVSVANGMFTVQLDFGANVFDGNARWLEIAVRRPAGGGSFTTLGPRQALTAQPYSLQTRGITVDNAGNVGLGTTAPVKRLTVAGNMEIGTTAGDYQHLRIGGGNSSGFLYGSYPGLGDGIHMGYNFYYDGAGTPQIINPGGGTSRVTAGYGHVDVAAETFLGTPPVLLLRVQPGSSFFTSTLLGLNISTPAFLLHVNGSAGKPGGGSWSNSSDRRLKKDIEPLVGALDQLLGLQGVTFEYIDPKAVNELEGRRIGMIAQDVEQVFPDWVEERKDGYKTVTYRGFEALAVEALRDLRAEKDAEIASLRAEKDAEIAALRARLDAIEQVLPALVAGDDGGAR